MDEWPELPYDDWRATRDTLHLYLQMLGKLRKKLSPEEPNWQNVPLYVTARGLNTSPIPHPNGVFDVDVDFVDHLVSVRTATGKLERIELEPRTVASFYRELMGALDRAGVSTEIETEPGHAENPTPFPEDLEHRTYDAAAAHRFWRALVAVDTALKAHRARFDGRVTPVQLWWGSLDLAYSRYSRRREHAMGFWPGDAKTPAPAFYAYTAPKPEGIETRAEGWSEALGEFVLQYDSVRTADDPQRALREWLDATYSAGVA